MKSYPRANASDGARFAPSFSSFTHPPEFDGRRRRARSANLFHDGKLNTAAERRGLYAACCALAVATAILSYQFYQERHKTTEAALLAAPLLPLAMICLMRDSA